MKGFLKAVGALAVGFTGGFALENYFSTKTVEVKSKKIDKYRSYYNVLVQWVTNLQNGKKLEDYFEKKGYREIAVYGMGELGARFCRELSGGAVKIKYGIDKSADEALAGGDMETFFIEEDLEKVDAVVVAIPFAFEEIEPELSQKMDCPILSLEDIVFEL